MADARSLDDENPDGDQEKCGQCRIESVVEDQPRCLRGCIAEEIVISGPSKDLHSGYYGGAARNPIRVLTKILGELHDRNGKVTLPGFYDGVDPVPASTRRQWKSLNFPEKKYLKGVGLSIPAGEKGYPVYEQIWSRPTAEINGIYSGYTGAGSKTVLPAVAIGASSAASLAQFMRSSMMQVLAEPYIRAARAKGLPKRLVIGRHALRNALISVATIAGLQFGLLLGRSVVIETVFAYAGIGRLMLLSIQTRDLPLLQGAVFFMAIGIVLINLITDVTYAWLDPRIRL